MASKSKLRSLREIIENLSTIPLTFFAGYVLYKAMIAASDERIAVSASLMGIFTMSLLALSLPRLRILEAFGVKANLDEQIRKAEITIDQLRSTAKASAQHAFDQMGSRQRCDMNSRSTIDALNEVLKFVDASEAEAKAIRNPFMDLIARDIFHVVQLADVHLRGKATRRIHAEIERFGHVFPGQHDPHEAERTALNAEKSRIDNLSVSASATADSVSFLVERFDSNYPRSEEETTKLRNLIFNSKYIMKQCVDRGNISENCQEFLRFKEIHRAGFAVAGNPSEKMEALIRSRFADERLGTGG